MALKDNKSKEPVSSQEVYQALCGAASQDAAAVKTSSELLKDYQDRPGTYDQLHLIAAERSGVPLDVRRMAIIQFKNGALGTWRNKRLFTEDQRANVRSRTASFLHEEDNIIADCNALIVARIARTDYPMQWPSLMDDLMGLMQSHLQTFLSNPTGAGPSSTLLLRRTLRVIDQVVKEFCSIKMPGGIKTMAQLADSLYSPLISYYDRLSSLLLTSFNPTAILDPLLQRACEEIVEVAHLVFKPCVKVMLWLWQKSGQPAFRAALETLSAFAQSCFQLAQRLYDLRLQLILAFRQRSSTEPGATASVPIPVPAVKSIHQLTRHLRLYGKMFRRMLQLEAKQFVALPQANELVLYYWGEVVKATNGPPELVSDSPDAVYPVRILVQGMVLFRESLAAWSGKGKPGEMTTVLSEQYVQDAVRILLTRFIPLAPSDLEKWMVDPEEWVNEEEKEGDAWEYEVRPCAERVLMTLCNWYHPFVIPLLLETFQQVLAKPTSDLTSILQKEAMYCAVGRCAHKLQDKLDFDSWLEKYLSIEAQDSNPDFRIVKRRIAWVIGKWYAEQCETQLKAQIWEILRHLMQDHGPSSDPVVRLTAAEALRACVDSTTFQLPIFQPYLGDFIAELIQLVAEADTLESKNRVTKALNVVIERVQGQIVPFIDTIISPLPQLWQDAGDDYLLKATLTDTVRHLVLSTREHSAALTHIVIPLVQETFSPKAKLQLDEDGLNLWQAALRNALTLESARDGVPGYIDMFPQALVLVGENLDVLGSILSIVESYIVLDANRIISMYGLELFQAFVGAMSKAVQTNIKTIISIINLIVQTTPAALWAEPMYSSGLFSSLAQAVVNDKAPALILTEHIYVFARMTLSDPAVFNQLVVAAAPTLKMSETDVFEGLLDQWWSKFDNMGEPWYRKLVAMGIAGWVSTGRAEVLGRLNTEIFNLWLDVFGELKEALAENLPEGTQSPLKTFWKNSSEQPSILSLQEAESTLESDRRRQIWLRDPISSQKLTIFVKEKLQQAELASGGLQAFQANYLDKADPTVLNQLNVELRTGN